MNAGNNNIPDLVSNILIGICICLSSVLVGLLLYFESTAGLYPDYSVFWTVAQMAETGLDAIYDVNAVTGAQAWLLDPANGLRPWIYPPSAIFVFLPFSTLPFWISYCLWAGLSMLAYTVTTLLIERERKIIMLVLILVSYPFWFALISGQTTLMLAALIIAGLYKLPKQEVLAGVLFGMAATVKPSLVLLFPLVMAAGRYWDALISSLITGVVIGAAGVIVFDITTWLKWVESLLYFPDLISSMGIIGRGVSFNSLLYVMDVSDDVATVLQAAMICIGIILCWFVFKSTQSLPHRLAALIGCGFFITPYSMNYEVALLIPSAAFFILREKKSPFEWWVAASSLLLFFPVAQFASVFTTVFTLSVCADVFVLRQGDRSVSLMPGDEH